MHTQILYLLFFFIVLPYRCTLSCVP